jgi:hypothetical protein
MKTQDIRNDAGQLTGFSVSNLLLSRHGVPKIVETIDGAKILRKQRRFALSAPNDFCAFEFGGKRFLAIEPFGDNSEFCIVTDPVEECPQIDIVRRAFESY